MTLQKSKKKNSIDAIKMKKINIRVFFFKDLHFNDLINFRFSMFGI